MYGPNYLCKIYNFMNNTDKKIFATGDMDQLQPFGFQLNNVPDIKQYLTRIFNIMFPNQIILEHNKGEKTEKHPLLLKKIKQYIFNLNIDVATTMKKYFRTIYRYLELKTNKNISFFNFRAEKINKIILPTFSINL